MGRHRVKSSPGSTKTGCKTPFGSSEAIFPPPSPVLPSQKGEGHAGELQSGPCKECRWFIRNLCRCSCSSLSPPAALPCSFVLENPLGSSFKKQECSPQKKKKLKKLHSVSCELGSRRKKQQRPLRKAETHRARAQGFCLLQQSQDLTSGFAAGSAPALSRELQFVLFLV